MSLLGHSTVIRNGLFVLILAIVLYRVPFSLSDSYQLRLVTLLVIYATFTTGLEFAMGRAGLVSLGNGGFFAIGAYTEGILQTQHGIGAWPALVIAILIGAICGLVVGLPALRVSGPYLTVVTIGFGLTVQALLYVSAGLTGGASGLSGTSFFGNIGLGGGALGTYYAAVIILIASLILLVFISWGNLGLALKAISARVTLARACGVNVRALRLSMFALSAAVTSAAGAAFGTLGFISPDTFALQLSIFPVVALVLGGIGTVPGPVIGAFLLYGFNQVADRSAQGSALLYGVLLMVVPLLLARGLAGLIIWLWRRFMMRRGGTDVAALGTAEPLSAEMSQLGGSSIELRHLSCQFGSLKAVTDVSVNIAPGEIVGLVGPNGSGKSTLLNMVSGYYAPSTGRLIMDGIDITHLPMYRRVRRGVLPAFQTAQLMDSRSVRDNLAVGMVARARWGGGVRLPRLQELLSTLDEGLSIDATAGNQPEGTRKIVEIGRCLLSRPRVLLLDEPTSGLSSSEVDRIVSIIRSVSALGVTVILADHNFEFVGTVCGRLVVLESGEVLATGKAEELRNDERVVAAYLGTGMASRGDHAPRT